MVNQRLFGQYKSMVFFKDFQYNENLKEKGYKKNIFRITRSRVWADGLDGYEFCGGNMAVRSCYLNKK